MQIKTIIIEGYKDNRLIELHTNNECNSVAVAKHIDEETHDILAEVRFDTNLGVEKENMQWEILERIAGWIYGLNRLAPNATNSEIYYISSLLDMVTR